MKTGRLSLVLIGLSILTIVVVSRIVPETLVFRSKVSADIGQKAPSSLALEQINIQLTPTITSVPTNTPIPTMTPSPTPIPTQVPEPTEPSKNTEETEESPQEPKRKATSSGGGSLLSQVNEYRKSHGLSDVSEDSYTCDFASLRAGEIASSFNHDGFRSRIDSNSLPYPSYSKVTENIAMNSDPNGVVNQWINSAGHAENLRADTPYACIRNSGNYYVYVSYRP